MFEGAKLAGKADEVSHILDQVAEIKRNMTAMKSSNNMNEVDLDDNVDDGSDFFLNAVSDWIKLFSYSCTNPDKT
ncbi:unnamed protein product [Aspergillus oryzae]|uniref:Unnamed protein product n=1 Tax=Aspergillus oryzae TaxID=5062 RepID=A0AAN5BQL5_ASPOZ|nr:unnamed protein product [Aspergillus oryzae]GMF91009.1 unnamed protein product [Aspergillus oryzae]GMG27613.1 unnamed protein product [Aspergillus oryzae]